jgi:hypothetical protein
MMMRATTRLTHGVLAARGEADTEEVPQLLAGLDVGDEENRR